MCCLYTSGLKMESDELKPRRLAATTVAKRVAEERRVVLGEEVGYSIQFDYMFNRNGKISQIKYLTNKELLREMMRNPLVFDNAMVDQQLAQYSVVVVDEAHERSVDNDVLLGLLKKIIQKRQDLRLVISSASVGMKDWYDIDECGSVQTVFP